MFLFCCVCFAWFCLFRLVGFCFFVFEFCSFECVFFSFLGHRWTTVWASGFDVLVLILATAATRAELALRCCLALLLGRLIRVMLGLC